MRRARSWLTAVCVYAGGFYGAGETGGPLSFFAGVASAAPMFNPSTSVVLFTPSAPDPLVARLEAELASVGIAVRRLSMPPESSLDAAVTREIGAGASAVIRIIGRSRGTEVWTGDTAARVLSRRSARPATSDAALSVIALRTVEFLRASLLDVKGRSQTRAGARTGPPEAADQPGERGGNTPIERVGAPAAPSVADRSSPAPSSATTETPGGRSGGTLPAVGATQPAAGVRGPENQAARPAERTREPPPVRRRVEESPALAAAQEAPAAAPPSSVAEPAGDRAGDRAVAARVDTPAGALRGTASPPSRPRGVTGFDVAAGPAVLVSRGGIAPIAAMAAIGGARLTRRFGVEIMAVFPVAPARLSNRVGSVEVTAALLGAAGNFQLVTPGGPWLADVAAGVSATLVRSVGSAVAMGGAAPGTSAGHAGSVLKPTGHLRLGGGYRLNGWLMLRADVVGGFVASRTTVSYVLSGDVGDYGSWGPIFAGGALTLQASW